MIDKELFDEWLLKGIIETRERYSDESNSVNYYDTCVTNDEGRKQQAERNRLTIIPINHDLE